MNYTSNLSEVVQAIETKLNGLGNAEKLLRQAALDSTVLISDRVQQDGLKTNDSPIQSYYSYKYGRKRSKKGFQIRYVDLTFSGDMLGEFIPAPSGNDFVVGFKSEDQGKIAEYNEERFGLIFNLTSSETDTVIKGILNRVNDTLK